MQYGIWCTVSGGLTNRHQEAWMKEDGAIKLFDDKVSADDAAIAALAAISPWATATFTYTARLYS